LAQAAPSQPFRSHCAPDAAADLAPSQLTVLELKVELELLLACT
jgi:hypothetical protein